MRSIHLSCVTLLAVLAVPFVGAGPAWASITYTDLYTCGTPAGFSHAYPYLVFPPSAAGGQVVGDGSGPVTQGNDHALLWTSAVISGIDLNPNGFAGSHAFRTNGTQQVGLVFGPATAPAIHAALWNGTAESFVDLNPNGFIRTEAYQPVAKVAFSLTRLTRPDLDRS